MERAPWFIDPEVLIFGQVLGVTVFVVAVGVTLFRRLFSAPLLARVRRR
jgi:hypothetical protein